MFQPNRQLLSINGELYEIKRIFKEEDIKSIELLKEWFNATHVFKKEGLLYFCDKIIDLEPIEEDDILEIEKPEILEIEQPEPPQESEQQLQEIKQEQSI